jgi:hypothetical protein
MSEPRSTAAPARAAMTASTAAFVVCTLLALVASGCVAPGYSREQEMLFEDRILVQPRFGVFLPSEGDYADGTVYAARISYEYDYNSFFSLELSGTEDVEQEGTPPNLTSLNQIRDLEHLALDESERRSAVISFDWDYPFSSNESTPYLRWGIGMGVLHTLNSIHSDVRDDILALGVGKTYAKDKTMILVRPTLGLFWDPVEDLSLFVDAQYDYAEGKVRISVDGDDRETGVIDFSGINVLVGLSYSF